MMPTAERNVFSRFAKTRALPTSNKATSTRAWPLYVTHHTEPVPENDPTLINATPDASRANQAKGISTAASNGNRQRRRNSR